jgi:hypothetical protein
VNRAGVKYYTEIIRFGDDWLTTVFIWNPGAGRFEPVGGTFGGREQVLRAVTFAFSLMPDAFASQGDETEAPSGVFPVKKASPRPEGEARSPAGNRRS